jgi:hypothetical protein
VSGARRAVEAAEAIFFDRCQRLEVFDAHYALLCLSRDELELLVEALQDGSLRHLVGARVLRVDLERIGADLAAIEEEGH